MYYSITSESPIPRVFQASNNIQSPVLSVRHSSSPFEKMNEHTKSSFRLCPHSLSNPYAPYARKHEKQSLRPQGKGKDITATPSNPFRRGQLWKSPVASCCQSIWCQSEAHCSEALRSWGVCCVGHCDVKLTPYLSIAGTGGMETCVEIIRICRHPPRRPIPVVDSQRLRCWEEGSGILATHPVGLGHRLLRPLTDQN